jgi:hypothetical protein
MAKDNDDKDVTAIRETRPCGRGKMLLRTNACSG